MSAEDVLNHVLLAVGLDRPGAQLTAGDFEIDQIKAFMNEAGTDIARRAQWSGLFKEEVFQVEPVGTTIAGSQEVFDLPEDFYQMAQNGTVWWESTDQDRLPDEYETHAMRPVVSPEQWAFLKRRPSAQRHYCLQGGQIQFSPGLGLTETATMTYISSYWVEGKPEITQNADVLLIPERLVEKGAVWRWKRQKGMTYDDLLAEFEADLEAELNADRGAYA